MNPGISGKNGCFSHNLLIYWVVERSGLVAEPVSWFWWDDWVQLGTV